jgi:hypothetical protein
MGLLEEEMVSERQRRVASVFFGKEAKERLEQNLCPRCGGPRRDYRDHASRREAEITGLCQRCQDFIFGDG